MLSSGRTAPDFRVEARKQSGRVGETRFAVPRTWDIRFQPGVLTRTCPLTNHCPLTLSHVVQFARSVQTDTTGAYTVSHALRTDCSSSAVVDGGKCRRTNLETCTCVCIFNVA